MPDPTASDSDRARELLEAIGRSLHGSIPPGGDRIDMREVMYRPGAGTWFSATFRVNREGNMDADFDYDNEPQWDEGIPDGWFAKDLERFPRDDTNRPPWLTIKLRAGQR